jgi:predicted dehydrogenase
MTQPVTKLRHVVIGAGASVFGAHRPALALPTVELIAVCDSDVPAGQAVASSLAVPFYADYQAMLAATRPDVAVIMTPHPLHAPIAIDCLRAGCHVLTEKPMADQVAAADAMIETAERAGRLLAVNFQQRLRPEIQAARRMLAEGRLGAVQHVSMIETWTRSAAYYRARPWRGTWIGEGAGVLLNQAPHNLDLVCYLAGMPARVAAWTRRLLHKIETEDTAQAILEWPDGSTGSIHVSTAEAGLSQRLEILGTGGMLRIRPGELTFEQFDTDLRTFIPDSPSGLNTPGSQPVSVPMEAGVGDHTAVYRNLHAAILEGKPLAAPAREARMSLELANAMIYSSYTGQVISLPLERVSYTALLESLRRESVRHQQGEDEDKA